MAARGDGSGLTTGLGRPSGFRPGWFVNRLAGFVERRLGWFARDGHARIAGIFRRNDGRFGFWNDWSRLNGWVGDARCGRPGLFAGRFLWSWVFWVRFLNPRFFDPRCFWFAGLFSPRFFNARFLDPGFFNPRFLSSRFFGSRLFRVRFFARLLNPGFLNPRNFWFRFFGIGFLGPRFFRGGHWWCHFFGLTGTTDFKGNVTFLTVLVRRKEIVEGADADVTADGDGRFTNASPAVVTGHVKGTGPGNVDVLGNIEIHGVTGIDLDGVVDGPKIFNVIDAVLR